MHIHVLADIENLRLNGLASSKRQGKLQAQWSWIQADFKLNPTSFKLLFKMNQSLSLSQFYSIYFFLWSAIAAKIVAQK